MKHPLLLTLICLLPIISGNVVSQTTNRKPAEVRILNADSWENRYPGMRSDGSRFLGNVMLSHEDVLMQCDSAHRYANDNIVHAFGNVRINQGDTLRLYGEHLVYYGNRRFAEVRRNVILMDNETTLTTGHLDFDLENEVGYYPNHGVVINGDNRLESLQGYYYTNEKLFFFKDQVVVTNPDYIIRSDTLRYNTVTEVVYFMGPTTIIGDDTDIYCENGWYNTISDIAQFNENARVRNNNQYLMADSLYYDNGQGFGEAFTDVEVTDTVENIIIRGNYAWFNREPEHMLVTERALLIQMSDNDTLYMHADTLRSWLEITPLEVIPEKTPGEQQQESDSLTAGLADSGIQTNEFQPEETADSLSVDTHVADTLNIFATEELYEGGDTVRIMVAYYGVKFFSNEMQGKCDSVYFNMRDSIVYMFGEPVVWSDDSQLSAEFMEIHSRDGAVDNIVMTNSAFVVSEEDEGLYNQIKGREILGIFRNEELYRVNVTGNAETLYYLVDDDEIIGVNKAVGASLAIFMKDSKPDRVRLLSHAEATLYPLEDLTGEERFLQNFIWLDHLRPKIWEDVFKR